ncbi:DEAD/DEAH box helicase [bacterium]|nr:DEAD/DEAH box helicase [bacterium]
MVTEKDVYAFFGRTYASRGSSYQRHGAVRGATLDSAQQKLFGQVKGSQSEPYEVEVVLTSSADELFQPHCSCPMGGYCKHSAALILHLIRTTTAATRAGRHEREAFAASQAASETTGETARETTKDIVSKNFESWLGDLQNVVSENSQKRTSEQHTSSKSKSARDSDAEAKIRVKVIYLLAAPTNQALTIQIRMVELLENDVWGNSGNVSLEKLAYKAHSYLIDNAWADADADIGQLLMTGSPGYHNTAHNFPAVKELSKLLLEMIVATGRCYWQNAPSLPAPAPGPSPALAPVPVLGPVSVPLKIGPSKEAHLRWKALRDGKQQLRIETDNVHEIVARAGIVWYLNEFDSTIGAVDLQVPDSVIDSVLACPPLTEPEVELAVRELKQAMERLAIHAADSSSISNKSLSSNDTLIPNTISQYSIETRIAKPLPRLKLTMARNAATALAFSGFQERDLQAFFGVDYGDDELNQVNTIEVKIIEGKKITILQKDRSMEELYLTQLEQFGLVSTGRTKGNWRAQLHFRGKCISDWFDFIAAGLPALKSAGWQIEIDGSACLEAVVPQEWFFNCMETSTFWFDLELGIMVDGKRVALLPIIQEAFMMLPDVSSAKFVDLPATKKKPWDPLLKIETLEKHGMVYAPLEDGRFAALPAERVKAIVGSLLEFFNKKGKLGIGPDVSLPQLMDLSKSLFVPGSNDLWVFGDEMQRLAKQIKAFEKIQIVEPPLDLQTTLRPYQIEGLCWLNFLREFKLGGILADDMGLGKTVQTLAHILLEKQENRLNKPYLIVCPTSVLPNWLSEITKFTPTLVVTPLYGPERQRHFSRIPCSDIVLTTYPLINRDLDSLRDQQWKAVILDEAQFIKNASTQVAKAVTALKADFRVCLTGTPVENNLGEVWSQFNFLMPGFLGDRQSFRDNYRTPIEKKGDKGVQKKLAERIRPFLLRRKKENVAKDLPEKTIIIKKVEISGAQRDLYETMRVAMYYKVQEALETKGLARSQMVILEAMLKLRQTCCDPRLLPLNSAQRVEESAKLELLLLMLEQLVAEGRKILLFSQFTSMIDLIIPELTKRKIAYVQIRGSTKDRATPVKQFQEGEIPLFLLSLKAGGTGLNLTAADTVIHYDPWWNPAVENQATDRAHRIGQKKPVFVFKLIASDTIEERILTLQEIKRHLAENLYSDDNSLPTEITQADIEQLFAPPMP